MTGASRGIGRAIALLVAGVGEAAEIADAVAFFAASNSRWVTGQTLDVNGGLWLGRPVVP